MMRSLIIFMFAVMILPGCSSKPTETDTATESYSLRKRPMDRISIVFGGDIMQHMPQITAARRDSSYVYADCFRYIKPIFEQADLVVLNLEATISPDGRYSGYPFFAAPPTLISALGEAGADVLLLANNHIADKGVKGVDATVRTIEDNGLRYTGMFPDSTAFNDNNPLILDIRRTRLAILNYTYGLNGLPVPKGTVANVIDTALIKRDLRKAHSQGAKHTVVCFHWGDEYARKPNKHQRELAAWCRDNGVTAVIGSHPHVIQPLYSQQDATGRTKFLTAYSLGNLVSNQRYPHTDGGMILRMDILDPGTADATLEVSYTLTWVHIPYEDGRSHYRILPSYVADTLLERYPRDQWAYRRFITDSRNLLADSTPAVENSGS